MKQNWILAITSGSVFAVSGLAHLLQEYFPLFTPKFVFLTFSLAVGIGIYCLVWVIIQATRVNVKETFAKKEVKSGQ